MDDNEIGIFLSIAAVFQISYQVNYVVYSSITSITHSQHIIICSNVAINCERISIHSILRNY